MLSRLGKIAASGALTVVLVGCNYTSRKHSQSSPVVVQSTRESIQRDFVNVYCLGCHTQANAKNRFVDLTDIVKLAEPGDHTTEAGHHHRVLVQPGCPKQSLFLSILKEGKMPPRPAEPVPAETLRSIESWIVSLKPDAGDSCNGDEPGAGVDGDEPG